MAEASNRCFVAVVLFLKDKEKLATLKAFLKNLLDLEITSAVSSKESHISLFDLVNCLELQQYLTFIGHIENNQKIIGLFLSRSLGT